MLDRLCLDLCGQVFALLGPVEVAATRGCSRALVARLPPAARAWAGWGRFAAPPRGVPAALFAAIYPSVLRRPPAFFEAALRHACRRGWCGKARWLIANARIRSATVWHTHDDDHLAPLETACRDGQLEVVRMLVTEYKIPVEKIASRRPTRGDNRRRSRLFQDACARGHLETAQWLESHFRMGYAKFHEVCDLALRLASVNGHLAIAQWLVAHFPFEIHALRRVLMGVCERGSSDIASWLVAESVGVDESRGYSACDPMQTLCRRGDLAMVQQFADRYYPITEDGELLRWLCIACAARHYDIAEWLISRFSVATKDPRALAQLCHSDHADAVRWLMRRLDVSFGELLSAAAERVRAAVPHTSEAHMARAAVDWLHVQRCTGALDCREEHGPALGNLQVEP
jgi:hypothetical protein